MKYQNLAKKLLLLLAACCVSAMALFGCQSTEKASTSEHPTKEHPEHPTTNAPAKTP